MYVSQFLAPKNFFKKWFIFISSVAYSKTWELLTLRRNETYVFLIHIWQLHVLITSNYTGVIYHQSSIIKFCIVSKNVLSIAILYIYIYVNIIYQPSPSRPTTSHHWHPTTWLPTATSSCWLSGWWWCASRISLDELYSHKYLPTSSY